MSAETVKELARMLGHFLITVSCSDQRDSRSLCDLLRGAAADGCWISLDEMNRLPVSVLSVLAMQLAQFFRAKAQHLERIVRRGREKVRV